MGLVFVPKVLFIRQHSHDPREKEESQYMSKEQEDECKQLNQDNEVLRKKLKEVRTTRATTCHELSLECPPLHSGIIDLLKTIALFISY